MIPEVAFLPVVLRDRLKTHPSHIENFCQRWNVQELALFGSVIRDDFTSASDIDVLIELKPSASIGLFDIVQMQEELSALFGRSVDLTQKRSLKNPFSKAEILSTHRVIYPPEKTNFTGLIPANVIMTEKVRDHASLFDTVKAAQSVKEFLLDKAFEDYLSDEMLQSAVERNLEILSRKIKQLSVRFQSQHPEIVYGSIVDLGNELIHQYDKLDYQKIWNIATNDVPLLLEQVRSLVPNLPIAEKPIQN